MAINKFRLRATYKGEDSIGTDGFRKYTQYVIDIESDPKKSKVSVVAPHKKEHSDIVNFFKNWDGVQVVPLDQPTEADVKKNIGNLPGDQEVHPKRDL